MTRLRSVVPADETDDLRAALRLDADSGQIWLDEHRMLLVHAEAQALLRKELIDSLGMERAQGLLMRMGHASGVRDAELARKRAQECSDLDAFMTGPRLHTLEGIAKHNGPVIGPNASGSHAVGDPALLPYALAEFDARFDLELDTQASAEGQ